MKNTFGLPLVFIMFLALVACRSSAAQERGHVIEASKVPRTVVAADEKVTLFVDWDTVQKIGHDRCPQCKRKTLKMTEERGRVAWQCVYCAYGKWGNAYPWHSTMMYTVNRTDQPITIRRTSYFDGNSVLEYQNKDKKWQRTPPRYREWGFCATGQRVNEFWLLPGKCFVEPVMLQKTGKMETVRFRLFADGKNYLSNPHRLRLQIDPRSANATEQDDWAIAYGTTDLLRKLINDEIKFPRGSNPFGEKGVSESKLLAIQMLAEPWHSPSESIPILNAVINADDKHYAPIALTTKKLILQRESKAKDSM